MRVATIVPVAHLGLIRGEPYQMCLAHLVARSGEYAEFYREESRRGSFVLMDNGVVELGYPMAMADLIPLAIHVGATEMVLPDAIGNAEETVEMARRGLLKVRAKARGIRIMAVPHGRNPREWSWCVRRLLGLPVDSIGVSKYTLRYEGIDYRLQLLRDTPGGHMLLDSGKDIHLLGCGPTVLEARLLGLRIPGRARGIDSGVAAMAAQEGKRLQEMESRPEVDLDFGGRVDEELLRENIRYWAAGIRGESPVPSQTREEGA